MGDPTGVEHERGAARRRSIPKRLERRTLLRALTGAGIAGVAGCLGDSGDGADGDDAENDRDADGASGSDDDPYYREELRNAIDNLDAPEPGAGVVVFENEGEYHTGDVECAEDNYAPDDPDKGTAEGVFEFEDGAEFSVELSRVDDVSSLQNGILLTVPNPEGDDPDEVAIPRFLTGIKPEADAEGSSAFVIKEGGTWYGGLEFDPPNGKDYGETWVAVTCS